MPTKAVSEYSIASVLNFMDELNLERTVIKTDGEPTICALAKAVKARRKRPTDLEHGSLKDSASMGAVEGPIRWWQAKVRTLRYDLEKRYGIHLTASDPLWPWLTRYTAWATSTYRTRADGNTSHKAAYGVGYRGEILPFGETALFKVPESHSRQVAQGVQRNKGDSMMVKGIWVGKHRESDDHVFLTVGGWHRARTVRRLEPACRADAALLLKCRAAPWEPRSARPLDEKIAAAANEPLVAGSRPAAPGLAAPSAENPAAAAAAHTAEHSAEPGNEIFRPGQPVGPASPGGGDVPMEENSSSAAAASSARRPAPDAAAQPDPKRQATGQTAAHQVPLPPSPPRGAGAMRAWILDDSAWGPADQAVIAEAVESETKRMRFTAAVSLDDPIDYAPLDGLTVDLLSKVSGLTDELELAGKKEVLEMLAHYGVYEDIPMAEATKLKELRARWEPQKRGDEVKWRYVAQEFKWMETRDDVFAASSTAQMARMVDFVSIKEENYGTFFADCIKAYYQADQLEEVCVKPPIEYLRLLTKLGRDSDIMWRLKKMLPGQRIAGAGWIATARKRLVANGYECNEALPQFYYHREKKTLLELHMDDIHGTGPVEVLKKVIAELRETFDIKASDVITAGRYSHLKRERLRLDNGDVMIRPSVKYIDDMIALMCMQDAKPAVCPSLPEERPEDDDPALDEEEATIFRSVVGIALYVTPDRADIQRDVQVLTRTLKAPTCYDRRRLVRLVRYLKGTRTFGMVMKRPTGQKGKVELALHSDTDFAQCKLTRRAMTCGVTCLDKVVTSTFARRQGVQSTSSGEAEFYGATSVVMDGRIVKHFLEWLGYEVHYVLCLDSSAAKAMVQRDGVGKVKHLDTRALWIQAERRDHGLTTRKVPGEKNLADLGTKAHPAKRFLELRDMMGIIDCARMDRVAIIEACSVEAGGEVDHHLSRGWTMKLSRPAAKLERQLLLALLAAGSQTAESAAAADMTNYGKAILVTTDEESYGWLGWCVALLLTLIFVGKWVFENYELRKRTRVRTVLTQSMVTYKTDVANPRFTPLAEGSSGAWATEHMRHGYRDL